MSARNLTLAALLALAGLSLRGPTLAAAERREPFELRDGDRVVLLGGTFFERAQRYGHLETAMQLRFPDRKFSVRNLGWSGDTVFAESRGIFDTPEKGYARMLDQVRGLKPTVIFLHYGGNEAFNGLAYLDTFLAQYGKLIQDLSSTGAELVLFSPRPLFHLNPPLPDPAPQNEIRRQYGTAIQKLAEQRGLRFVSLFPLLKTDQRTAGTGRNHRPVTDDGLQLNDFGYRLASHRFVRKTFGPLPDSATPQVELELNADGSVVAARGCRVSDIAATPQGLSFQISVPQALTARARLQVRGLPAGSYEVRINGRRVNGTLSAEQLSQGTRDAERAGQTLAAAAHEPLRELIIEKNQMYFHRWRPQNVTYLFLFRKHEQGNNAKEVEEFEQIVRRLDDRIFERKQQAAAVSVEVTRHAAPRN